MDRRDFLLATGLSVAGAAKAQARTQVPSAADQSSLRPLTLALEGADAVSRHADQARGLAARLGELSGGSIAVTLAGPAPNAAMSFVGASALTGQDPAFGFLTGLPGRSALSASSLENWLLSGGQTLVDALAATYGVKLLLAGHCGARPMLWSRSPLGHAADLAGQRVGAAGLGARVAAGIGASPVTADARAVQLASGDVGAIEAGLLDAASRGLTQVATHAYAGGFTARGTANVLQIQLGVWNGMDATARALITAAAAGAYRDAVAEDTALARVAAGALAARPELTVAALPHAVAEVIETVARAVVAEAAASSPAARSIDASYMAFRHGVRGARLPRVA
jgi:TRAP-type mannitol/chloroaromatic compound transport system substrate-binding protein